MKNEILKNFEFLKAAEVVYKRSGRDQNHSSAQDSLLGLARLFFPVGKSAIIGIAIGHWIVTVVVGGVGVSRANSRMKVYF